MGTSVFMLAGVAGVYAQSADVPIPSVNGEETRAVREWAILGPLPGKDTDAFDRDFLVATPLPGLPSNNGPLPSLPGAGGWRPLRVGKEEGVVDLDTFFHDRERKAKNTAAYAVVCIKAAQARRAYFLARADDELRVALNGREVFTLRGSRELGVYQHAIPLELNAGNNLLVVKIVNIGGGWGFSGYLAATDREAADVVYAQTRAFLAESLVLPGQGLALFGPGVRLEGRLTAVVERLETGERSETAFVDNAEIAPPARPPGLYRVDIDWNGQPRSELFHVGTLAELARDTEAKFAGAHYDEETMDGLGAYVRRVRIVADAAASSGDLPDWDRRVILENLNYKGVYAAGRFNEALHRLQQGQPAFRDVTGLSIGAFRSAIDGQTLHYRLYVPTSYRRGTQPLPLVVVVHPPFTAPRPFIGGPVIANQREAELWSSLAEELGVGLLWEGYRAPITGDPPDLAHLEEVLKAVSRLYDIDTQRITLWGECGATANTVLAVKTAPERYAGALLQNVALWRNIHEGLRQLPAYQAWLDETDPLRIVNYPLPIYLAHDSPDEGHGPIADTYRLSDAASRAGRRVEYWVNVPDWPNPQPSSLRTYLTWLSRQRREQPSPLVFHDRWPRGPISTAFAEPFIVVMPSAGPGEINAAARQLGTTFLDLWKKTYFGPCRVVEDRDFSPEMETKYNLVLIGNAETNLVWQRLAASLPISVNADSVRVYGDTIPGADAIQAWCPHPTVTGRKIVLLGGSVAADLPNLPSDFCLRGWFDCAIWRNEQGTPQAMDLRCYPADAPLSAGTH